MGSVQNSRLAPRTGMLLRKVVLVTCAQEDAARSRLRLNWPGVKLDTPGKDIHSLASCRHCVVKAADLDLFAVNYSATGLHGIDCHAQAYLQPSHSLDMHDRLR